MLLIKNNNIKNKKMFEFIFHFFLMDSLKDVKINLI